MRTSLILVGGNLNGITLSVLVYVLNLADNIYVNVNQLLLLYPTADPTAIAAATACHHCCHYNAWNIPHVPRTA